MNKTLIAVAMLLTSTASIATPTILNDVSRCSAVFGIAEHTAADLNRPGEVKVHSMAYARMFVLYVALENPKTLADVNAIAKEIATKAQKESTLIHANPKKYPAILKKCTKKIDPYYGAYVDTYKRVYETDKMTYDEMTTIIAEGSRKYLGFN